MAKPGDGLAPDPTLLRGGRESMPCGAAPILVTSARFESFTSLSAGQEPSGSTELPVTVNYKGCPTYVGEIVICDNNLTTVTTSVATEYRKRWRLSADTVLATCKADKRHNLASKFGLSPKAPARKFGVRIW